MYIPLYVFTVHLLYYHCILIRYSYYIVVTYVDIIVPYYFFFISDHELITISFHSIEQFSCRQLYKVILYVSDMGQLYLHIFTHICLYIYIPDILTTYVLYICSIQV